MDVIANKTIKREAQAMQMVYGFNLSDFTELAGKYEFDGGFDRETAERMAIEAMRSINRK